MTRETWKNWNLEKDSILVFGRGYVDYGWYYELNQADIFFVTRARGNMQYAVEGHRPVTKKGVTKDDVISFVLEDAEKDNPDKLRLINYWDEKQKEFRFLTDNFDLLEKIIADIYKER